MTPGRVLHVLFDVIILPQSSSICAHALLILP